MSTKIPYLDEMWGITSGCGDDMVSPGCTNCYARRMFGRNLWKCPTCNGEGRVHILGVYDEPTNDPCPRCHGTGRQDFTPTFHADRLDQPLHWRKPRRIGVSFMGDLFHEAITRVQIGRVLDTFIMCPQHTFLVLTKRPERMREVVAEELRVTNMSRFLNDKLPAGVIPNLWLGVTVCNQEEADRNVPLLLDTPAAVRWVSYEPALEAVDFSRYLMCEQYAVPCEPSYPGAQEKAVRFRPRVDWLVAGGETGPGARPMQPKWALDVYRQCKAAGVAFWFKQWGKAASDDLLWRSVNETGDLHDMAYTHELPAVTT